MIPHFRLTKKKRKLILQIPPLTKRKLILQIPLFRLSVKKRLFQKFPTLLLPRLNLVSRTRFTLISLILPSLKKRFLFLSSFFSSSRPPQKP
ncbi:unnamed protein product [Linum tenue]|uniref:Uncharacterized protein n=1 Tax=Linum tenue TaxID=586396 RepID=A0AAV0JTP4_9ROSI|nr:unnamed protein product [Linum tenue]